MGNIWAKTTSLDFENRAISFLYIFLYNALESRLFLDGSLDQDAVGYIGNFCELVDQNLG